MVDVAEVAQALVQRAGTADAGPLSALGLEELAALYGVSRSTLLRQIGSRRASTPRSPSSVPPGRRGNGSPTGRLPPLRP